MKKKVFGRGLSRDKNERIALFKGLMSSLVLNESIQTTEAKAKAIKGDVEKLVTKALRSSPGKAGKLLGGKLNPLAIDKMFKSIAPRFKNRNGGYTRIIKLGKRFGDDARMVVLEWVEKPVENLESGIKNKKSKGERKMSEAKSVSDEKKAVKPAKKTVKKPAKRSVKKQ